MMSQIKKGDIVGRKSYGKDIIFVVNSIINIQKKKIAILKGLIERIEADSEIEDLELIDKIEVRKKIKIEEQKIEARLETNKRTRAKLLQEKYFIQMEIKNIVKNHIDIIKKQE